MSTNRIAPAVSIAIVAWTGTAPTAAHAASRSVRCGSVISADTTLGLIN